jgi:hypothetical protein
VPEQTVGRAPRTSRQHSAAGLPPRFVPRNVAKGNVAKRYFGAPLISGRPTHFRSRFKLHCDKEIGAVNCPILMFGARSFRKCGRN